MTTGAHVHRGPVFGTCFPHYGKQVHILTTGAHVHRGPVFGTCFP